MADEDYVLGTNAAEIERLGLQHDLWRERAMDGWRGAGIGPGMTVIDVGAGPGFATLDLAEMVGSDGRVIAVERSPAFAETLRRRAAERGHFNVEVRVQDVVEQGFGSEIADAAWCRWLLSFVSSAERVVDHIASALKPGGVAIFHEYASYETWQVIPTDPLHTRFVDLVTDSWREAGGDPNAALRLPALLEAAGMELVATRPIIAIIKPSDPLWQWPASFVRVNAERLCELGRIDAEEAELMAGIVDRAAGQPGTRIATPLFLEIVARKG